jgi:hypothetical protein
VAAPTSTTFVISSDVIIFTTQLAVDATILGISSSPSQTTRYLLSEESLPVTLANSLTLMSTSLVSFERQLIVTASQMANPTMTTAMDGGSIVPEITATNSQPQSSSTSSLADEENLSISNFPMPSSALTQMEQIFEGTAESSSSSVSADALDRQQTSATLTVGNSKRRNDFGAILLSYYTRNVGVVVLFALSFILLFISLASNAVVRYLIIRRRV